MTQAIINLQASTSSQNPDPSPASAHAVSVKLPEFWPEDPEVWFIRVEAQLRSRSVTQDQTKFDYLVSSLDNYHSRESQISPLSPPADDKYKALKAALLSAFGKSQTQKDAELFNLSGLGDRTSSALLRRLESLNNDAETLRRAFFLAQSPSQVRAILALQGFPNIHDLATAADHIVEARSISQTGTAAAVSRPNSRALSGQSCKPAGSEKFICTYHKRFGQNARNCRPGCLFAKIVPAQNGHTSERNGRPPVTAAVDKHANSSLSVWDRHIGTQFLVDSDADVCVFPASATLWRTKSPSGFLSAANRSKIDIWGQRALTLNFGKN